MHFTYERTDDEMIAYHNRSQTQAWAHHLMLRDCTSAWVGAMSKCSRNIHGTSPKLTPCLAVCPSLGPTLLGSKPGLASECNLCNLKMVLAPCDSIAEPMDAAGVTFVGRTLGNCFKGHCRH